MAVYVFLLVYIAMACCNACLKVEFKVDKFMGDKTSNTDLQFTLSGISTDNECGIKCMETKGCMSFFYNEAEGSCRLHSTMFKSSESSLVAAPGFTYRKPFCPPLANDVIPNGKTGVFSEGGFLVARTVCESDAIFVGKADSVKCDADGFWPEMGPCALTRWSKPTVPFNESIPFTTKSGTVIEFVGRSFGKEFQMEIGAGSEIALYMKASEDGNLERGYKTNVKNEHTIISTAAFYKPAKDFKCSLKISSAEFTLSVGDDEVFTESHEVEVEHIDQLRFMGGIELKELRMNQ
ncbi:uncharacterized protein [Haliotis asinina]|uniref:uncharacterized protein n=1 Tax=Haliotis asinina TaxID=109174 RepID=UPI003531BDDC